MFIVQVFPIACLRCLVCARYHLNSMLVMRSINPTNTKYSSKMMKIIFVNMARNRSAHLIFIVPIINLRNIQKKTSRYGTKDTSPLLPKPTKSLYRTECKLVEYMIYACVFIWALPWNDPKKSEKPKSTQQAKMRLWFTFCWPVVLVSSWCPIRAHGSHFKLN